MAKLIIYALIDPDTEEIVFQGNAHECAEFCGGTPKGFYGGFSKSREATYHGYRVTKLVDTSSEMNVLGSSELTAAAKKWDAFCEPIRKRYGIPVYKPDKEEKP